MRRFVEVMLCGVLLAGCGVANQRTAIRDARYGLIAAGAVVEAMDTVADEAWCKPALVDINDVKDYCKCKRAALVLTQSLVAVQAAADGVKEWETALVLYEASKDDAGWQLVVKHQGEWITMASHLVAIMDALRATLELYGVKLPPQAAAAWKFIGAISPYSAHESVGWDWASLKGSICESEVLP